MRPAAPGRSAHARAGLAALALACGLGVQGAAAAADDAHKAAATCRVALGEVKDIRTDPVMGTIGTHVIRVGDPAQWTRDGFKALSDNRSLEIVPADGRPDVTLNVELVKAYVEFMATAKSATVVLRVRYAGRDAAPRVYRGVHTGTHWANDVSEMQGALALALGEAVKQVSAEAPEVCAGRLH
jgi:hypothetical protein